MSPERFLFAAPGAPPDPGFMLLLQMGVIVVIFYFIWFRPMRQREKKREEQIRQLKPGDKVVLNAGIFAQIVAAEDDAFLVRVDDKTRLKVLRSAVAGLQSTPNETTEKK